jgi:glycosyltransferase involved in cell wall biosynthesis
VVVIGRNEGERLRRCLQSVDGQAGPAVYVDSGSVDASVATATALGWDVVRLDATRPFTAARARNAGLHRLVEVSPECEFVQFVDGDCEVVEGWIAAGSAFLMNQGPYAVVCGRRRERFPEASLYNRLCDLEWNTPVGEAVACGGDALMRLKAVHNVGGFDETLIAGEEPELCSRLSHAGWRVMRLDKDMTVHDANVLRFGQWWRRSSRAGWAFISGAAMAVHRRQGHWLREAGRPWLWCLVLPVISAGSSYLWGPAGLLPLLAYPLAVGRSALSAAQRGGNTSTALAFGLLCMVGKLAELQGQLVWLRDKLRRRPAHLLEYKNAG